MGTSLRTIVYDIGRGAPGVKIEKKIKDANGNMVTSGEFIDVPRKVKAVQIGGPSGGCIPEHLFDKVTLDFESVQETGAILGSGGLVVMDEKTCIVDVAKFFIKFSVDESCGKCTPCRIGNKKLLNILEKFSSGVARESNIEELEKLSRDIMQTSLCGLGQSSPNPILSTIQHFRDEYVAHINGKCPAGMCFKKKPRYYINEKCISCAKCVPVCPVDAIHREGSQ